MRPLPAAAGWPTTAQERNDELEMSEVACGNLLGGGGILEEVRRATVNEDALRVRGGRAADGAAAVAAASSSRTEMLGPMSDDPAPLDTPFCSGVPFSFGVLSRRSRKEPPALGLDRLACLDPEAPVGATAFSLPSVLFCVCWPSPPTLARLAGLESKAVPVGPLCVDSWLPFTWAAAGSRPRALAERWEDEARRGEDDDRGRRGSAETPPTAAETAIKSESSMPEAVPMVKLSLWPSAGSVTAGAAVTSFGDMAPKRAVVVDEGSEDNADPSDAMAYAQAYG